jgi:G3E family GTPase
MPLGWDSIETTGIGTPMSQVQEFMLEDNLHHVKNITNWNDHIGMLSNADAEPTNQ